jgi:hypothetical protein
LTTRFYEVHFFETSAGQGFPPDQKKYFPSEIRLIRRSGLLPPASARIYFEGEFHILKDWMYDLLASIHQP